MAGLRLPADTSLTSRKRPGNTGPVPRALSRADMVRDGLLIMLCHLFDQGLKYENWIGQWWWLPAVRPRMI